MKKIEYTPQISVIVPVYNVQDYVEKCISSIMEQSFTDYECIVVDDASKDNSISIVKQKIKNDKRFRIIHHKTNQGSGISRNTGIENAIGEYICFIDSDDYIEKDYLEVLYNLIKKHNAKMACCNLYFYTPRNGRKYYKNFSDHKNWEDALENFLATKHSPSPCIRLYKTELFDKVKYPKGDFEDNPAYIHLLLEHKFSFIPYTDKPLYNYVYRKDSTSKYIYGKDNTSKASNILKANAVVDNVFLLTKNLLIKYKLYDKYESLFYSFWVINPVFILIKQGYSIKLLKHLRDALNSSGFSEDIVTYFSKHRKNINYFIYYISLRALLRKNYVVLFIISMGYKLYSLIPIYFRIKIIKPLMKRFFRKKNDNESTNL